MFDDALQFLDDNAAPIGLSMQTLSALTQGAGNARIRRQQAAVIAAERQRQEEMRARNAARQEELRHRAEAINTSNLNRMSMPSQDARLAEITASRERVLAPDSAPPAGGEYAQTPQSTPDVVDSTIARQIGDYITRGRNEARQRAAIGAYGDLNFDNNIALGRGRGEAASISHTSGRLNNQYRTAATESQAAVPLELMRAHEAARGYNLAGDILGGAGELMVMRSIAGPNARPPRRSRVPARPNARSFEDDSSFPMGLD